MSHTALKATGLETENAQEAANSQTINHENANTTSMTTQSVSSSKQEENDEEKFVKCMVFSAMGDALGYKGGSWEFSKRGESIHEEANALGGVEKLELNPYVFPISDDTVMHWATALAFVNWDPEKGLTALFEHFCKEYVKCWDLMDGRAPGIQCAQMMPKLKKGHWDTIPFSPTAGGCGAAMRTMCIGLIFWRESDEDDLIRVSVEAGRMTHNHPTGFLGGVVAAVFTSFALRKIPVADWGYLLVTKVLPRTKKLLEEAKRDWEYYKTSSSYFENHWEQYIKLRKIDSASGNKPVFPEKYGVAERDAYYKEISYSGWGGSSGHDSVIIAYDALLACDGDWIKFCNHGALHGGDSDSTGAIGAAWFGVLYPNAKVPENHWKKLEFREDLEKAGKYLFALQQKYFK